MPCNVLLVGGADAATREAFSTAAAEVAGGGDIFVAPGPFRRAHEIDEVRDLTRRHRIGLIVPTIDDDLPLWAALSGRFAAEGTCVAVSPVSTVAMCHDRHLACRSLGLMGIATAQTWLPSQVSRDVPMPLWVLTRNPRHGADPVRVTSYDALDRCLSQRPDAVVQAAIDGAAFTVEACCDARGQVLAVVPSEFAELAVCVASAVRFVGAFTIDGVLSGDRPVIHSISARLAEHAHFGTPAGQRVPSTLIEMALERRRTTPKFGGVSAAIGAVA
jgi:hypothetical protein